MCMLGERKEREGRGKGERIIGESNAYVEMLRIKEMMEKKLNNFSLLDTYIILHFVFSFVPIIITASTIVIILLSSISCTHTHTHTHTQFERSVVSKVMGQVLESYNMSFKDVLKVVVTKMDLADALIKQLGVVDT